MGPQIAYLYGTACRSLPGFFILDDHDYFVNDDAREKDEWQLQLLLAWLNPYVEQCVTLPPDEFFLELARTAQNLYLPEFLPDPTRPSDLPGAAGLDRQADGAAESSGLPATGIAARSPGVNEVYGTVRYGDLLEGVCFELRRFLTLDGEEAGILPLKTEGWIRDRMEAEETRFFGWRNGTDPVEAIETLEPHHVFEVRAGG